MDNKLTDNDIVDLFSDPLITDIVTPQDFGVALDKIKKWNEFKLVPDFDELIVQLNDIFNENKLNNLTRVINYLESQDSLSDEDQNDLREFKHLASMCHEFVDRFKSFSSDHEQQLIQLESMRAVIPCDTYLDNTKLTKSLKRVVDDRKNIPMEVIVGTNEDESDCIILVNIEDNNDITISGGKYTAIDQANLRAIEDLYIAGNKYFTPDMIYRARKGYTDSRPISPNARESIINSITKMSNIKITIDYTNQYKTWFPKQDFSNFQLKKTEPLLPLGVATIKISGEVRTAYYLLKEPLLYEYGNIFNHVIKLPSFYLNTKDVICRSSGDEDDIITQYLLIRIGAMKHPVNKNKLSRKIAYRRYDPKQKKYSGIFVELGFIDEPPTKQKAIKIRKKVDDILASFKIKQFIFGYKPYKKPGTKEFAGYEIILDKSHE